MSRPSQITLVYRDFVATVASVLRRRRATAVGLLLLLPTVATGADSFGAAQSWLSQGKDSLAQASSHLSRGEYRRAARALEVANHQLRQCLKRFPRHPDCLWEMGWVAHLKKDWSSVVLWWGALRDLVPNHRGLKVHFGRAQKRLARYRKPTRKTIEDGYEAMSPGWAACSAPGEQIIAEFDDLGGSCGQYQWTFCVSTDGTITQHYYPFFWSPDEDKCAPPVHETEVVGLMCQRPFPKIKDVRSSGFGGAYDEVWQKLVKYLGRHCVASRRSGLARQ